MVDSYYYRSRPAHPPSCPSSFRVNHAIIHIRCWCSSSSSYDDNGSGNCDMRCSGDSGEYCGGFFSMTVSRTEDYDDSPSPTPSGTLGCYQDKSSDRIMDLKLQSNIMTNAVSVYNN